MVCVQPEILIAPRSSPSETTNPRRLAAYLPAPAGKYAAKRRGFVVSLGEDLGAIKISGWTHTIPEYFDLDRFWAGYPGARERGGGEGTVKGRTSGRAAPPA